MQVLLLLTGSWCNPFVTDFLKHKMGHLIELACRDVSGEQVSCPWQLIALILYERKLNVVYKNICILLYVFCTYTVICPISLFLNSSTMHIWLFLRSLTLTSVEDILQILIVFAVESLELDFALLFPERHILLRVLPVLVVLATSSEKDSESLYKRVKINRLINIFKVHSHNVFLRLQWIVKFQDKAEPCNHNKMFIHYNGVGKYALAAIFSSKIDNNYFELVLPVWLKWLILLFLSWQNDPVIPAFSDLHLSPAAILKELSSYFQKFSSQTRLLTLPAPHELPLKEAQEYPVTFLEVAVYFFECYNLALPVLVNW